jgi:CDP-glucose 4,6-dehydratase
VELMAATSLDSAWVQRRVFVTGATGIVGAWLVKRLIAAGAQVAVLVRDYDPQSELVRSGDIERTSVVNGCLEDYATLERAISQHESDTVFHLGAQPIVTVATRSPLATRISWIFRQSNGQLPHERSTPLIWTFHLLQ